MSSTAAALTWRVQVPQLLIMGADELDLRESVLRAWKHYFDKTSVAGTAQSERQQTPEPVSNTDYDATQDQVMGAALLEQLPEGYALRYPIPLDVHRAPSYFWVTAQGGFLHGVGDSRQAAVEDYGYALLDYYHMLLTEEGALAPHLTEHLRTLKEIISEDQNAL